MHQSKLPPGPMSQASDRPIKTLGLIHTSATLIPVFNELCKSYLPEVRCFNLVDDALVGDIMRAGSIQPGIRRRVASYLMAGEQAGADQLLVTCSSIGPAVEWASSSVSVPVMRVDQPMADQAIGIGHQIGVVATLPTTLNPTLDLIERRSARVYAQTKVRDVLVEGAFDALMAQDPELHDRLVGEALIQLSKQVDVIVLAQASMARVIPSIKGTIATTPILSSPETAIRFLAESSHCSVMQ
jgi:Asp/Glu/hydantoin racemase